MSTFIRGYAATNSGQERWYTKSTPLVVQLGLRPSTGEFLGDLAWPSDEQKARRTNDVDHSNLITPLNRCRKGANQGVVR